MTYDPNIPQPTDNISTSQGQILTNFDQANIVFGKDHFEFDYATSSQRGMHEQVNMPQTIQDLGNPLPSLGAGTAGQFFSQTSTNGTTHAEPYWANALAAAGQVLWYGGLTSLSHNTGAIQLGKSADGYITFPNSLQLVWGLVPPFSTSTTVTFALPFTVAPYAIVTGLQNNPTTSEGVITATTAVFNCTGSNAGFYYLAIGLNGT